MNNRIEDPKARSVLKGLAKLTVATALGMFVYETAPEAFKAFNGDKTILDLYNLRINGQYLSYVQEVFEMITYPIIESLLGLKAIKCTRESYENFIGKSREEDCSSIIQEEMPQNL